ncbi:hypothetical protein I5677_05170 [Mobilitalea sibirica]|uniref:Uncharacterized protein n=1 Tax=Mobilitalea sibirica TaxID=1462919 RepID=A0A8J7KWD6_9FIRM|nr:hypothetical protein [Mobilitalea sibirica]MBH1940287.1 hypothetical protein [Mobilitalea sibirica]
MLKSKLMKSFAIGLCLSALYTGTAFAQSGEGSMPSRGEIAAIDQNLIEKQSEIDIYLFKEHVKDIEERGFEVVFTGIADPFIEIGITPYSEENANYLYEIFGKDAVQVVAAEDVMLYTTQIAPDAGVDNTMSEPRTIDAVIDPAPDTPVSSAAGEDMATEDLLKDQMINDEREVQIQITSAEDGNLEDPSVIYQTTAVDTIESDDVIRTVSAETNVITGNPEEESTANMLSAPIIILLIAGGAAMIGGVIIISNKKKIER